MTMPTQPIATNNIQDTCTYSIYRGFYVVVLSLGFQMRARFSRDFRFLHCSQSPNSKLKSIYNVISTRESYLYTESGDNKGSKNKNPHTNIKNQYM